MAEAGAVLTVMVEVDPEHEDEFNRWYDEEHVPEKLATPGFLSARRFRMHDGSPNYLVIYELTDANAATGPDYMAQDPTAWGSAVMAKWASWSRSVWIDLRIASPRT